MFNPANTTKICFGEHINKVPSIPMATANAAISVNV